MKGDGAIMCALIGRHVYIRKDSDVPCKVNVDGQRYVGCVRCGHVAPVTMRVQLSKEALDRLGYMPYDEFLASIP